VSQLNPRRGALLANETRDAREHLDVVVFPDAKILRADATFGRNRRRFGEYNACSSDGATAEMDQMPVICESVGARIFAHWRDGNPVS
jgi:hypothetical protein